MKLSKVKIAHIEKLLDQLHQVAIDKDPYELGLPLWDGPTKQLCVEIVAQWVKEHKEQRS